MTGTSSNEITRLLDRMASEADESRKATYDRIFTLAHQDLKRRTRAALRGNEEYTRPTGLVHELYGKLAAYRMNFQDRQHFLNAAAQEMRRRILTDVRRQKAQKRGGCEPHTTLSEGRALSIGAQDPDLLIDIDRAVDELPLNQVRFMELYWYAGFTLEQTAEILGITFDIAKYRWDLIKRKLARKFILEEDFGCSVRNLKSGLDFDGR